MSRAGRAGAAAAGLLFAAFVAAKGVPTLRHDWSWPIVRDAIPSFLSESASGWVPVGFGVANAHPTAYLASLPIALAMWILGPLPALALTALATGYVCMRAAASMCARYGFAMPAAVGIGLCALFNPWVYNEVVAGHLVMVLAYGGVLGMLAEISRGRDASPVRLALWLALVECQLQFFIVAMLALVAFACATRKWLPVAAGFCLGLPSIVGLAGDRATLLAIPYTLTWQKNQSLPFAGLLGLGGYFPGYADRLGVAASLAVWVLLGLAVAGLVARRRSRVAIAAAAAAAALFVAVLGVNGPLAFAYEWIVRNVPESGVFRELYDLAGMYAALLALLACAAAARWRPLGYVALFAGVALVVTWLARPPSDLWVGAASYPHPVVSAAPFERVALTPAFQPLGLRAGGGDGADPDVYVYPGRVAALNSYLPAYPVDMALARYERDGDPNALRALGVGAIVARPWLVSLSNGHIGLAARSLGVSARGAHPQLATQRIEGAAPLVSECASSPVVASVAPLDPCDRFFGDALPGAVRPIAASSDSIDPRTDWIDARLVFAQIPALAQGVGGAFTQSRTPFPIEANAQLLAYVRGTLRAGNGRALYASGGAFRWLALPQDATAVWCDGLCELVATTRALPAGAPALQDASSWAMNVTELTPWLYLVRGANRPAALLRFNERYDPAWVAVSSWRVLPHVRAAMAANGWLAEGSAIDEAVLVQRTALLQAIAEILGFLCLLWLLKALQREPTKRAP